MDSTQHVEFRRSPKRGRTHRQKNGLQMPFPPSVDVDISISSSASMPAIRRPFSVPNSPNNSAICNRIPNRISHSFSFSSKQNMHTTDDRAVEITTTAHPHRKHDYKNSSDEEISPTTPTATSMATSTVTRVATAMYKSKASENVKKYMSHKYHIIIAIVVIVTLIQCYVSIDMHYPALSKPFFVMSPDDITYPIVPYVTKPGWYSSHSGYANTVRSHHNSDVMSIVTECRIEHLKMLENLCYSWWDGAISVAIYIEVSQQNDITLQYLFEFITKLDADLPKSIIDVSLLFENSVKIKNDKSFVNEYPKNALRNLALNVAFTDFVFLMDINFMVSNDLHRQLMQQSTIFRTFRQQQNQKHPTNIGFIILGFEVTDRDTIHANTFKTQRSKLIDQIIDSQQFVYNNDSSDTLPTIADSEITLQKLAVADTDTGETLDIEALIAAEKAAESAALIDSSSPDSTAEIDTNEEAEKNSKRAEAILHHQTQKKQKNGGQNTIAKPKKSENPISHKLLDIPSMMALRAANKMRPYAGTHCPACFRRWMAINKGQLKEHGDQSFDSESLLKGERALVMDWNTQWTPFFIVSRHRCRAFDERFRGDLIDDVAQLSHLTALNTFDKLKLRLYTAGFLYSYESMYDYSDTSDNPTINEWLGDSKQTRLKQWGNDLSILINQEIQSGKGTAIVPT